MANNLLLLLAALFLASSAFLVFQRGKCNVILDRLRIGRRRVSGAKTPPRYLSPGKKQFEIPEADYSDTFPPSRSFTLSNTNVSSRPNEQPKKLIRSDLQWTKNLLPLETSYLSANPSMHTPCGFSVEDIKTLGDFPDYATLSGVPLPEPYREFNIQSALPRPYRPFRWAYHQTMCMYPSTYAFE